MKAHTASLLNAIALILCPAWGYLASDLNALTGLMQAAIGFGLLLCYQGVKKENKVIAHIAVTLTVITFVALFLRLPSILNADNFARIARFIIMEFTAALALTYFVKSFRDARTARDNE